MKILLVGRTELDALEHSYERAFKQLGHEVETFDIEAAIRRRCRLGLLGRSFNTFVPVEVWITKANRDLVFAARAFGPDIVLVICQSRVRLAALAQLRAELEGRLVLIWPDPLINLSTDTAICLPLYDLVATFASASGPVFECLGARKVAWAPLAADPLFHAAPIGDSFDDRYDADVSFIGGWRPEREAVLSMLSGVKLKIWGPDAWRRRGRNNPLIRQAWQGRPVLGEEFARVVMGSRVNLNIIDSTGLGAANMRFFEIPCAGGLQVSSPCPDMEHEFEHGKTIFYYRDPNELPALVRRLLDDPALRQRVACAGHDHVLKRHTYEQRARQIIQLVEGRSNGQSSTVDSFLRHSERVGPGSIDR